MRCATAYLRQHVFFVHSLSKTTDGVWIFTEPCLGFDGSASDYDLGKAVADVLDYSKINVRHPTVWTGLFDPVLKLANVRSWSQFVRSATCAELAVEDDQYSIVPTTNLGPNDGFEPRASETVRLRGASIEKLGAGLRTVLESHSGK
jgi:hypothetical protein